MAHALWAAFAVLAAWHFVMAAMPAQGSSGAVPSVNGKALFKPSRMATVGVGVLLLLFAALVAATAGILATGIAPGVLAGLSYALAAGLLARAIGDFKYVGLFKRVRGSKFATLDSWLYSPLCLALSAAVASVAWRG
ncbi:MAG: DUF3995 domain-containing protein [Pseudomonadota bacterium]